jgi:hypothetical protein
MDTIGASSRRVDFRVVEGQGGKIQLATTCATSPRMSGHPRPRVVIENRIQRSWLRVGYSAFGNPVFGMVWEPN